MPLANPSDFVPNPTRAASQAAQQQEIQIRNRKAQLDRGLKLTKARYEAAKTELDRAEQEIATHETWLENLPAAEAVPEPPPEHTIYPEPETEEVEEAEASTEESGGAEEVSGEEEIIGEDLED